MKKITSILIGISFVFPLISFAAAGGSGGTDLDTLIGKIADWINILTPIVVALALLYFFYGLAVFILRSGDEEKRKEARSIMMYGVIALFVMVSVWGLVSILVNTLEIGTGGTENVPYILP